ncbi:hypothetical protein F5Y18DRAFT_95660 [Xylariaceae sp. FL1019]|nr:hypothetical protein F5Y18DRAFT_95660 [Xylariaceae sp. FL1019]
MASPVLERFAFISKKVQPLAWIRHRKPAQLSNCFCLSCTTNTSFPTLYQILTWSHCVLPTDWSSHPLTSLFPTTSHQKEVLTKGPTPPLAIMPMDADRENTPFPDGSEFPPEMGEISAMRGDDGDGSEGSNDYMWPDPRKVVRAVCVGTSDGTEPVFAEASYKDGKLPKLDDTRDGVRLVGPDGKEHDYFTPSVWFFYLGAIVEVKKYLYGLEVMWMPLVEVKRDIPRDSSFNHNCGYIAEAIVGYLHHEGRRQRNDIGRYIPSSMKNFMDPS